MAIGAASSADRGGFRPGYFEQLYELESSHFWFRVRNRIIAWSLRRYFPDARSFFEIGCGTGFVLSGLASSAPALRLFGSDYFAEGLAFAKDRVPAAMFLRMDARRTAVAAGSMDVVGAFDVLEHIPEDERVLHELYEAVRPGGGMLITVPQHAFLWSRQDEYARHVRRYSARDLRQKIQATGFTVERMTSFVSLLLPLMLASRLTKRSSDDFDPLDELQIGTATNRILQTVLEAELTMIRMGVRFPAGGSLLAVARKAA